MPARPRALTLAPEAQKQLSIELFNYTWALLEKDDRSDPETDRMIDAAHASRFFWEEVGEPVNHARGEWQISRVYAVAGRVAEARRHAELCLEICRGSGIGGFDLGFGLEAMSRAHALAGDAGEAARYREQAHEIALRVEDAEDRQLLLSDLETLPN